MKNLSEYIVEAAGALYTVMTFDHSNPQETFIIKNAKQSSFRYLKELDFEWCKLKIIPNGLLYIHHSDESPEGVPLHGLNQLKQECWKQFEKEVAEFMEDNGEFEIEFDFGIRVVFDDARKIKNAEQLWKAIEDRIKESYIEGDSQAAGAIIDPGKSKVIVASDDLQITFFETMDEFLKRYE